ncbi:MULTISPECIES: glycine betaine ABC transporter substrate-binding protein [Pasteurellaceae]|uniref:glycine betaine ABC transporter substrate-binding protein n=1 Tax=Pasteurellaceae TaxID=712 RepID=UPI00356AD8DD
MHKRIRTLLLLCLFSAFAQAAPQPIKFARLDWESGQFTTALLRMIIEKGYGYPTEEISGAGVALENALMQNDIQIIGEVWVGRSEVMTRAIAEGRIRIVGDTLKGGATQGWYIPDYVRRQYPELKSVADLPRFAHLFRDPNDPERARFLNCPAGWTCEVFNTRLLHNLKLEAQFNNVPTGTGSALDSEISAYYEQQKPLLFYYWQPTGLMAKYAFVPLEFPAFDGRCWAELLNAHSQDSCVSGFPVSRLSVAVSARFAERYPELIAFLQKVELDADTLNRQILLMNERQHSGEQQAAQFLAQYPQRWQKWVSAEIAERLSAQFSEPAASEGFFPHWSIQEPFNRWLKNTVQHYGDYFRHISLTLQHSLLNPVERFFLSLPPWLFILSVCLVVWHSTKRPLFTLFSGAGLFLLGALGVWQASMQTVALMVVSIGFTVILGIPLGIVLAKRRRCYRLVLPLLDVMQTMPSFVYLIPVLMLFGLGKVPAMFACIIYAIVPLIRLTVLGIRRIEPELLETGRAFGSSRWQMLCWIILPSAKAQIMAGINQTVMMSLSMVVLASMIGAAGLGQVILQAIQTLNVGQGLQAGGAIVILAIIVDRITQGYGGKQ